MSFNSTEKEGQFYSGISQGQYYFLIWPFVLQTLLCLLFLHQTKSFLRVFHIKHYNFFAEYFIQGIGTFPLDNCSPDNRSTWNSPQDNYPSEFPPRTIHLTNFPLESCPPYNYPHEILPRTIISETFVPGRLPLKNSPWTNAPGQLPPIKFPPRQLPPGFLPPGQLPLNNSSEDNYLRTITSK